jgi:hypothetical protein
MYYYGYSGKLNYKGEKMNKGYAVLTDDYCVGYVNASTAGKAKSLALSSSLITDDCEFIDLLIYR